MIGCSNISILKVDIQHEQMSSRRYDERQDFTNFDATYLQNRGKFERAVIHYSENLDANISCFFLETFCEF